MSGLLCLCLAVQKSGQNNEGKVGEGQQGKGLVGNDCGKDEQTVG